MAASKGANTLATREGCPVTDKTISKCYGLINSTHQPRREAIKHRSMCQLTVAFKVSCNRKYYSKLSYCYTSLANEVSAMSHTFHQLYFHFVWSTHSRYPAIDRAWRPQLLNILNEEVKNRGGILLRHNAMPDHVHLLVRLPPALAPAAFIGQVKGATAFRVNREIKPKFKFAWQDGYGVLSLRKDDVGTVARYIDRQEQHHGQNKLSALLEQCEIETDNWQAEEQRLADEAAAQATAEADAKPGEPG